MSTHTLPPMVELGQLSRLNARCLPIELFVCASATDQPINSVHFVNLNTPFNFFRPTFEPITCECADIWNKTGIREYIK